MTVSNTDTAPSEVSAVSSALSVLGVTTWRLQVPLCNWSVTHRRPVLDSVVREMKRDLQACSN